MMKELNELVELAEKSDAVANLIDSINPHTVLAIAEAFRALEQEVILLKQGCENNPMVHEMLDWKERAEAAEAKMAELEKQEPIAWMFEDELPENYPYDELYEYSKVDVVRMFPVFGPAPAINLSELVPDEDEVERIYSIYCTPTAGSKNALRHIRKEILRKIEEAQ